MRETLLLVAAALTGLAAGACRAEPDAESNRPDSVAAIATPDGEAPYDLAGIWTVTGHRILGVSAMSDVEATAWHGRSIRLTEDEALSPGSRCAGPTYERGRFLVTSRPRDDVRLPPDMIEGATDETEGAWLRVFCDGEPWTAMGGYLVGVDEDRAVTRWDGVHFDLARDREAEDVDYRAQGNEPGWLLEITAGGSIQFVYAYGERKVSAPAPAREADEATGAAIYRAATGAGDLRAVIEPLECRDSMSGFAFATTVTVTLSGETFRGCGGPLP